MKDTRTLEISRWGRHWIAQLRITPGDGTFPAGYVVTHDRIPNGKRGFPAVRRAAGKHGITVEIHEA